MHVLILGGTTEASELAKRIAAQGERWHPLRATLSLAGRTQTPALPPIPHRIGGFGGAAGLAEWIRAQEVSALVDATHPFAARMPFHAARAARQAGVPMISLTRPAWRPVAGDHWIDVADHAGAIAALGPAPRRVFLTVGRQDIVAYAPAPQHVYLVRSIDPIDPSPVPQAYFLRARGPFRLDDELELLRQHRIDAIVSKNSGGAATEAKLIAARELGLPVYMIGRPAKPDVPTVQTAAQAMDWIARVHNLSV